MGVRGKPAAASIRCRPRASSRALRGPVCGLLGQALLQQPVERRRHVGPVGAPAGVACRIRAVRARVELSPLGDGERRPSDEQVPDRRAEGVDVGGHRAVGPAVQHLRRRPRVGDAHLVVALDLVQAAGDAEVGERRLGVDRDQDVAGLDVAVHDARAVRGLDGAGQLDAGADRVLDRHRVGAHPHAEVGRRAVPHHEVGPAVLASTPAVITETM